MNSYDIVVIGGGAVGLSLSYLAAKRGYRVALVESGHLCSGATGRSAGIVTLQLSLEEDVAMAAKTIELFREVGAGFGTEFYRTTGFLTLVPERMLEETIEPLRSNNVGYMVLRADKVKRYVPFLKAHDHEVGVLTSNDMVVDASEMGRAFRYALNEMGVSVIEWNGRGAIHVEGGEVRGVMANGQSLIKGDAYVFAAGPWNKTLLGGLGITGVPLTVYKCQVVRLCAERTLDYVPFYVMGEHLYMRPDGNGTSIAGNGYARVVERPEDAMDGLEKEYVQHIAELLAERVLDPSGFRVCGGWSGPCSITPDGYPVIGRIPGLRGAYIVDGLDGYGLMRAAGVAELALKAVEGEELPKYSAERFKGREEQEELVVELHSV
ncbi:MAG: FAD-binding oxidoreductase [Nitrososphaerota archaeon]